MLQKVSILVFLVIICLLSSACSDSNKITCKSSTSVILKDKSVLNISIRFFFHDKKELRAFRFKEKEVMFALRLSLKQHKSSLLKNRGRYNVNNAIIAICKRRLGNKFSKVKIIDYTFTDKKHQKKMT